MKARELRQIRARLRLSQAAMARELAVAPNTVARWERGERPIPDSAERAARRLLKDRTSAIASVSGVDAARLQEWSRRRDSEARLPELVRQLVRATVSAPMQVTFRAAEGVQLGGWDGIVEVGRGNPPVPDGRSAWELSTNARPRAKADEDYAKRKRQPGYDPAETTFVFATSRRWSKKDDWAEAKRRERFWRDVRAYDADDLEQWLERAPGVRIWAARLLGALPPTGVTTLENFWQEWVADTRIVPAVVLAGREEVAEWLRTQLCGEPALLSVLANSVEEVAVFAVASLLASESEGAETARARALVVSDSEAWRSLVATKEQLILIPTPGLDPAVVPAAPALGHHAIVAASGRPAPPARRLPPLSPERLREELTKIGLTEARAEQTVAQTGRLATVLRRALSSNAALFAPQWAQGEQGRLLAPLLLAGSWDETVCADRVVVEKITQRPYAAVSDLVLRWASHADPPFKRTHSAWRWVSHADAWQLLGGALGRRDLDVFQEVAIGVLTEPNPKYDLPAEKRWAAAIHGHKPQHSAALRQGLAETLAIIASRPEDAAVEDTRSLEARAGLIVSTVLCDSDWRRWASNSDVLASLAEAAPPQFFRALDSLADNEVSALFGNDSGTFSDAPHTLLLWALEALSWAPEHLARAAVALGRLARLDPGGTLSNRPTNSLREIFFGLLPQTTATLDHRLHAIDALLRAEPEVGWRLLVDLIPQDSYVCTPTCMPKWRDWLANWRPGIAHREYFEWAEAVYGRVHHLLSAEELARWSNLIPRLADLPERHRTAAIERLAQQVPVIAESPARRHIRAELRNLLHHHRSFSDSEWVMPEEVLDQLSSLYQRLEPEHPVERFAWLFTVSPNLPEGPPDWHDEGVAARDRAREEAVRLAVDKGGVELLLAMSREVEQPELLGWSAGMVGLDDLETTLLHRTLGSSDTGFRSLGLGFVRARAHSRGSEWIDRYLGSSTSSFRPEELADLACGLRFQAQTWEAVARAGTNVDRLYWRQVHVAGLAELRGSALSHALEKFLGAQRPYAAIELADRVIHKHEPDSDVDPQILARVLGSAAAADPAAEPSTHPGTLQYRVQRLFRFLDERGLARSLIAGLEWKFLPLLERGEYRPKAIYETLCSSPRFFQEVLQIVYRAEGAEARELSQAEAKRTRRAWEVLRSWKLLPGTRADGATLDQEVLTEWVREARGLAGEVHRQGVADATIGQLFATSPMDPDDEKWPHIAIRNLIEEIRTPQLQRGFLTAIYNSRGVVTKLYGEGGRQERELSRKYRAWAIALASAWPLTAEVLGEVADSYEFDARREDEAAEAALDG